MHARRVDKARTSRGARRPCKQSFGRTKGGINTKISVIVANSTTLVGFRIAPGNFGDAPEGRALLQSLDTSPFEDSLLLMDRAYEGDETRALAVAKGLKPVVPPKSNRKEPWEYDKDAYKRRNEVERFFRRIKEFRRIATRYEKLDITFITCLVLAFIFIMLQN
jgi:transposase